jgi:glycosyltransferase involved in cell wall biosynthesis
MVGDGPLRESLERGADARLVLTGYRHGVELARLYACAEVFVFPSLTETFGNVLLEAMASGLPAVGFDVPGPRDVIRDGQTGRLVSPVSAEALGKAMGELATDAALCRRMGLAARRYAESQTWDRVNAPVRDGYAAVARSAVARRPRPAY